jgi:hypothetical protein
LPDRPTTQEGDAEPQGGDTEKQAVPPRSSSLSIKQNSSAVRDEPPTETADDEDVRDNSVELVLETSRRKQQSTLTNIKHNSSSTADKLSTEISDINDISDDFVEFVRETTIRKRRLDTGVELEVIEDRPLQTRSSNCQFAESSRWPFRHEQLIILSPIIARSSLQEEKEQGSSFEKERKER